MNWHRLYRALLVSSTIFLITGGIVLGCFLAVTKWYGPIILFGSLFIGITIFFYVMGD